MRGSTPGKNVTLAAMINLNLNLAVVKTIGKKSSGGGSGWCGKKFKKLTKFAADKKSGGLDDPP